ncbi:uncharacterized protein LAESUDRAFT_756326 [Laetiporus sulphureus 93-53]|uniref:Uncharacterized protein n=1 Tax=Laetiporus sulphureus 93-53 TaxID=1314785 RepID=A0A165GC11_9APHY|nr:uncharacterized protein LAESUDRAFT_756326 [Laetiporus sulphureus 93-53]KZT10136.1 hypothetical protein LAESUDRAFT_756326 [Laetiporus sulphureus 93-53]
MAAGPEANDVLVETNRSVFILDDFFRISKHGSADVSRWNGTIRCSVSLTLTTYMLTNIESDMPHTINTMPSSTTRHVEINDTPFPQSSPVDESMPISRELQGAERILPGERTVRRKKSSFDLRDIYLSGGPVYATEYDTEF